MSVGSSMIGGAALIGTRWAPLALAIIVLTGCGHSLAVVEGKVTDEGKPVASAEVMVAHADDTDRQFFGVTGEDGSLHVTYRDAAGAPPGRYLIHIRYATQRDGQPLPSGEDGAALRRKGAVMTREFVFDQELHAGSNALDLKLENGRRQSPSSGAQGR
jgi:hypothetical protein